MKEFVKSGNIIVNKPEGCDYELENGKVYTLKFKPYDEVIYLETDNDWSIPKKVYNTEDDNKFINRVCNYFSNTNKQNTGVLLSGLKGSGKTLTSKLICKQINLPIIVVDPTFPAHKLTDFFSKFNQSTVVLMDEIEKNPRAWSTDVLLSFLDGIRSTSKKLVIMTCNEDKNISQYMIDRCSRIRYYRQFDGISYNTIVDICRDYFTDKATKVIADFIDTQFKVKSYDNIISFIEEIYDYFKEYQDKDILDFTCSDNNMSAEDVMLDVISNMNISIKNDKFNRRARKIDATEMSDTRTNNVVDSEPTEDEVWETVKCPC